MEPTQSNAILQVTTLFLAGVAVGGQLTYVRKRREALPIALACSGSALVTAATLLRAAPGVHVAGMAIALAGALWGLRHCVRAANG